MGAEDPLGLPMAAAELELDSLVLANEDRSVLIRFRLASKDGPIRAYVITRERALPGALRLRIPSRDLLFSVGEDGVVELPGVAREDLDSGAIEIEVRPLPGDEA